MESKDERRGALTLVPAKDRLPEMLSDARNGADIAELVNKYGLKRKEAKALAQAPIGLPRGRRTKRVDKPEAQPDPKKDQKTQQDAGELSKQTPKYAPTYAGRIVGGCFILLGLIGAFVGGWINLQFGMDAAGVPGALIGVVVDGGAMLFMVAARELWRLSHYVLCPLAIVLWFFFVAGSTYAALNYTGVRLGDYFQSRDDIAAQRGDLASQIRRVEAQRTAIKEEGSAKVLENRVATELIIEPRCARKASLGMYYCDTYNKLKDAWTNADARDKLDATLTELHRQLAAKQAVASKNPAGDQAVQMNIVASAEQAMSWWMRWLATVPGLAGLMLTIGAALVGKR